MIWLRVYPRCGGDLVRESDIYAPSVSCTRCGARLELVTAGVPNGSGRGTEQSAGS